MAFEPEKIRLYPGPPIEQVEYMPSFDRKFPVQQYYDYVNMATIIDPTPKKGYTDKGFDPNDIWIFARRHSDYPNPNTDPDGWKTAGKQMIAYMKEKDLPENMEGLETAWAAIKSGWAARAHEAHIKLDQRKLEGLIERGETPSKTQLEFSDTLFYDVERGE